jgi:hypothetical protein
MNDPDRDFVRRLIEYGGGRGWLEYRLAPKLYASMGEDAYCCIKVLA